MSTDMLSPVSHEYPDNLYPSDLPEVVAPNYPIAHAYLRPRKEPGETAPKFLAYDQTDKEAIDEEVVSPTTPATTATDEAKEEGAPPEKAPSTICGFAARTFWIVLGVAIIVITAAIGGGVGGGIAASRSQHESGDSQSGTTSSISSSFVPTSVTSATSSSISTTSTTSSSSVSATPT
ncbi:hypothetical protein BJ170DRAFT_689898, partial [Xylariales sp. AK1849]